MTAVRWRRPEPGAWEARCGRLALLVHSDDLFGWEWKVVVGSWAGWDGYWDRSRPPPQHWGGFATGQETAIRDGLRALARAVRA